MSVLIPLPSSIATVLDRLENAGYEAYVVGGCVRDALMGKTPHDYDICTSATPTETKAVFADCRYLEMGIRHGTVTVLWENEPLEITTFRVESGYSDGRHPDNVSFTQSLVADLSRRDLTINAMAYSPRRGLADPFKGQSDLNGRLLRCVGEPTLRFEEDGLRILRTLRFAATLSFAIEPTTAEAVRRLAPRLSIISAERLAVELKKAIVGDSFPEVLLAFAPVFCQLLPELEPCIGFDQNNPHHDFDLLTHIARTVGGLPRDPILRLAGLLHDVAKPATRSVDSDGIAHYYGHASRGYDMAGDMLRRLKLSHNEIDRITALIRYHDGVIEPTKRAVKRRLNQLGPDIFFDLLKLQRADRLSQRIDTPDLPDHTVLLCQIANDVISESECFSLKQLAITGHDLQALGLKGSAIGKMLKRLLDAVLDGEVPNEKEALLRLASSSLSQM